MFCRFSTSSSGSAGVVTLSTAMQLLEYTAHSMGANSLCAAAVLPSSESAVDPSVLRVGVFSAGDDQAICCAVLEVSVGRIC